jgi:hypothetical protein
MLRSQSLALPCLTLPCLSSVKQAGGCARKKQAVHRLCTSIRIRSRDQYMYRYLVHACAATFRSPSPCFHEPGSFNYLYTQVRNTPWLSKSTTPYGYMSRDCSDCTPYCTITPDGPSCQLPLPTLLAHSFLQSKATIFK